MTISIDETQSLASQLQNCRRYWLGYGREERTDDGVSLYRSGVRHGQLNGILRVTAGRLPEALARAESFGPLPWTWWVGPDSYPGLADDLVAAGGVEVGRMPVMAAPADEVADADLPAGLTIGQVAAADAAAWVDAYADPMGVEPDQRSAALHMETGHPDAPQHLVRFAGRVDGRIVATSALLDSDGVAGIYVVSTQESYRRRGIGAALTAAAVAEGRRRGLRVTSLQSSPWGGRCTSAWACGRWPSTGCSACRRVSGRTRHRSNDLTGPYGDVRPRRSCHRGRGAYRPAGIERKGL